ncbi:MAG TPA: hypothetical protein VIK53_12110 [Verrucomicrobiae bacterium]
MSVDYQQLEKVKPLFDIISSISALVLAILTVRAIYLTREALSESARPAIRIIPLLSSDQKRLRLKLCNDSEHHANRLEIKTKPQSILAHLPALGPKEEHTVDLGELSKYSSESPLVLKIKFRNTRGDKFVAIYESSLPNL